MSEVSISINPQQIDAVLENLQRVALGVEGAAIAAVEDYSQQVYDLTVQMCPKDTGTLVATTFNELEETDYLVHARVGHGGRYNRINPISEKDADSYAIEVHESFKVKKKNNATAKWLEKALNSFAGEYAHGVSIFISQGLLGGGLEGAIERRHSYRLAVAEAWAVKRKARREKLSAIRQERAAKLPKKETPKTVSSLENDLMKTGEQVSYLNSIEPKENWVVQRRPRR